jgi:hypothetical protein
MPVAIRFIDLPFRGQPGPLADGSSIMLSLQRALRREPETGEANHERSDPAGGKKDFDWAFDIK